MNHPTNEGAVDPHEELERITHRPLSGPVDGSGPVDRPGPVDQLGPNERTRVDPEPH